MAYTEQELNRVIELFETIEGRKEHQYAAPTYLDSPLLKEMTEIMLSRNEKTEEELPEKITALSYLTQCYDSMCRAGMSVKLYPLLLQAHVDLMQLKEYSEKEMEEFLAEVSHAILAYNFYEQDDCEELVAIVLGVIQEDEIKEMIEEGQEYRKGSIKNDPVEKTEEYLAVIDAVEEKIEKNKTMDFCLEYWSLKEDYLMEYGIFWKSPTMLNPHVLFD